MNTLKRFLAAAIIASIAIILMESFASAQCASGQCSSRNATLGESASQLPVPLPVPAPAPQIAYFAAPAAGTSASSSASSGGGYPAGNLVVAGYTAPPQPAPQVLYYTGPSAQLASTGTSASSSASSSAPALIGASTNIVGGNNVGCSSGGCGRGGFFQRLRAPRARSVSISRSVSRS